jgi:tetratricopeptide (TPR) repeat protein
MPAANARAYLHYLAGDDASALRAIDEALAREPRAAWLRTNRGTILVARGEFDRGYEEYRATLERGEDATTLHNLGCLYAASGDSAPAVRVLRLAEGLPGRRPGADPVLDFAGGRPRGLGAGTTWLSGWRTWLSPRGGSGRRDRGAAGRGSSASRRARPGTSGSRRSAGGERWHDES